MSSTEIPLSLTARRAAVVTASLPAGATRIRIPPSTDGDLVRARVGGREVLLRIRVSGPSNGVRWLAALGVATVFVLAVVLVDSIDDAGTPSTAAPGASAYESSPEDPYDTATEEPDPYESGTCLNGTLPDSTTAQEVSGVDEVPCSAPDPHHQVIGKIPFTSDMSRCDSNSRTQ